MPGIAVLKSSKNPLTMASQSFTPLGVAAMLQLSEEALSDVST